MFGVQRLYKFIYDRICTDHKSHKYLPAYKFAYMFVIFFKAGKYGNADALSRLPLLRTHILAVQEERELMFEDTDTSLVNAEQERTWKSRGRVLSRVREHVVGRWPQPF